RKEDVPLLVEHFLQKFSKKMRRSVKLGEGVMDYLMRYEFPGNIRELENMVEQGVALAVNGVVELDDIIPPEARRDSVSTTPGTHETLQDAVDRAERIHIEGVLREVDGNKERAAEILGLSATTLWRKMKRLNVQ